MNTKLHGEYEVKLDDKSRLRLPNLLVKQLEAMANSRLVLNRGFEKCLILYPGEVWDQKTREVDQLNHYVTKNRDFIRYFYRGATTLTLDGIGRLLIPRSLIEHADIKQDIILLAYMNQIEIWSKTEYLNMVKKEPTDFSKLAEEVFGLKDG